MRVYDLTSDNEESSERSVPQRQSARIREKMDRTLKNVGEKRDREVIEINDSESSTKRQATKGRRKGQNAGRKPQLAAKNKVAKEKRKKRFRSSCPEKIQQRIERAKNQRMFLLSREVIAHAQQKFAVLGSTGNVYSVDLGHIPNCNCPDFVRGNLCKHILFVYLKVLRVSSESPYIYQAALLTSELEEILTNAPDVTSLANEKTRKAYEAHCQGGAEESDSSLRKAITGECPICYEEMKPTDQLVWCKVQCGNNVHEECWSHWSLAKRKSGEQVTCVYCRAEWDGEKGKTRSGYLNLGNIQGMSKRRSEPSSRRS
ncbi:hypothetical protein K493DRAFT_314040 [Basidiobolus meristosporus CBS 931.73]|uniref:SWIM-type domain-containing protein n=1 Tax=Basidiobolus meristosporus CBS 931.73 TaxID=1314790 RepID=A0A1Y1YHR5_9FUNG|nr:hypothetical protein K493DRAFT_314040 [Basidiobolus meristosporus CBS 931.73]|eukprot:ORX97519.1 hypothetical protein K493DRAFT_314040 [Basidiobolus meristosporus CBS 931.73]